MLFEKTIRKKKISPYYLEIWGYVFIVQALFAVFAIIIGIWFKSLFVGGSVILLGLLLTILIFLLSFFTKSTRTYNFLLPLRLLRDKKYHRFKVIDITIIDYYVHYIEEYRTEDGFLFTYTYAFFTEPFIYIAEFIALSCDTKIAFRKPLHIYMQKIHWTYRLHRGYKSKVKKWIKELEQEILMIQEDKRKYDKSKIDSFYLYMTYDKREIFNHLFELVNPHEFRITTYEKSCVFISIDPIPCKEYPPEALECMKKINAMYP